MTPRRILAEAAGGPAPAAGPTWTSMVAATDPAAPAVVAGQITRYGELLGMAAAAGVLLDELGLPAESVVPALVDAGPTACALWIAGAATRRPLAPLSARSTVAELSRCLLAEDAPIVLADPPNREPAGALAAATGRRLVVVDGLARTGARLDHSLAGPDDVAGVLHTSGTTGVPKRVSVRQRPLAARAAAYAQALSLTPGSVYASAASFHHGAGVAMIAVALATGAALTPMPSRFSVAGWRALADLGVTHANVVPSMLQMLLDADALQVGRLRTLLYGASRIEPELARATMAALPGVDLVQGYGQTEGGPHAVLSGADHRRAVADPAHATLLTSCGRPAPGVRIRIVADADAGDGVGAVEVSSPYLFAPGADGWLATGDLGRLDEAGYLHLVGRTGDGIVRGGENVHPAEVERVLLAHPAVRDAAVVGIPDARLGQAVGALIVALDPAAPPDVDELRRHVRAQLAGFKVPVAWRFVPELPRHPMGKLLRHQLPELDVSAASGAVPAAAPAPAHPRR
jgi:acyl-CoA synthetase (AMP-forming)/AMP-acid ligase II